jgi:AraC-like DNA-binding protein
VPVFPDISDIESVLHWSDLAAIGSFRCPPDHPRFGGGAVRGQLVVFPRTPVVIERESRSPVFADPNTVVFYNAGEEYGRRGIDRRGDHCDWFTVDTHAVIDLVSDAAPTAGRIDPAAPFAYTDGPSSSRLYLGQRSVVDLRTAAGPTDPADPLAVDEAVLGIVAAAATAAGGWHTDQPPATSGTDRRHGDMVREVKALLAIRSAERLGLSTIAAEIGASPYHLARMFRRHAGLTIHGYLTQLRLRSALERVAEPRGDLARLALELGFCSHSHFTRSFRTAFGVPPSALRNAPKGRLEQMRTIVTV